jgi:transposase-like protein
MTDYCLTPQQVQVIDALSSGATMTSAAQEAGIHRNTLGNWRRNILPFQYALAHAQYDRALLYREKLEDLADTAIQTLQEILADPKASAGVRLKAALAILQTVSTPPPPKKQVLLDIEKISVTKTTEPITEDQLGTMPPVHPQPVHISAQSKPQPIRRDHPKVGRNDLCPCGSNQKFKRCCLGKHSTEHAAAA